MRYLQCPYEWVTDKRIRNELPLLMIINSFENCFASNEYLAKELGETEVSISRKISKLQKLGYIDINYKKKGNIIASRTITPLTKLLTTVNRTVNGTVNQIVKDNNISINNINNNKWHYENVIDFDSFYANM